MEGTPSSARSLLDPSHFQNLFQQMQNNQNFLEKMQDMLQFQSNPQSEASQLESLIKNEEIQDEDGKSTPVRSMSYLQTQFLTQQMMSQDGNYMVDVNDQNMFTSDEKRTSDDSLVNMNEPEVQTFDPQQQQDLLQQQNPIDPNLMSQDYLQMFNQFYSVFIQLQQQIQDHQIDPTNENFINVMTQFFLQMFQAQQPITPQDNNLQMPMKMPVIDYNNLPLASIPESKESILEENSGWNNTIQTKKNLILSSQKQEGKNCTCCSACVDHKRSIYQCSNFNAGLCNNQDTFIQKSDVSSAASQIMGHPFFQYTPSPYLNRECDQYGVQALNVNQNLSQVFQQQLQQQQAQDYQQQQQFLQQMEAHQQYYVGAHSNSHSSCSQNRQVQSIPQSPEQYRKELLVLSPSNENQICSPNLFKDGLPPSNIMSPEQLKQTKLIEYMIDNNDFSNYKYRRCVVKGDRLSRTLSRSGNKNSMIFMHRQQPSFPSINVPIFQNQVHQNSIYQQIKQDECPLSEYKGATFSPVQPDFNIGGDYNSNREPFHFFSPQINSKAQQNQFFTAKNSFEDTLITQRIENNLSPCDGDVNGERKRKRTQEKIREIRRLNEQVREKQSANLKKSQFKKQVFEIKDLKKSKSKKTFTHNRKQSQNVVSNKENQKLMQSIYQAKYDMSEEQIVLQNNYDLINDQSEEKKDDSKTFKSLKSVWKAPSYLVESKRISIDQNHQISSPQITNLRINSQDYNSNLREPDQTYDHNNLPMDGGLDLRQLPVLIEKAPGQEIHIIKKPHQTEELKKIQERLNKYYKDKKKDEDEMHKLKQMKNQNFPENETVMSMTKTLSSFKSLMMKTMSQMSIHQENNIQQQYALGQKQRSLANHNHNGSVNMSSIQDDFSVGGELSDNLTKIISPKNLYNGQIVKHRNIQKEQDDFITENPISNNPSYNNLMLSPQGLKKPNQQSAQCLPNALFFNNNDKHEDTLSLKYQSRQPSMCNCGKKGCICEQKKDLLGHFQNFLQEMDKQQISKHQLMRESILPSPITNINNNTHDFLLSNYQGRSSSQNSLRGVMGSSRQSTYSLRKIKRFSSGSALLNLPLLQNAQKNMIQLQQNSLSTNNLLRPESAAAIDSSPYSRNSAAVVPSQPSLEKLDTNKEEEIRILNMENDMIHKDFIMKSHRLNLEQDQRKELLQRIQKYKEGQQVRNNNSNCAISSHSTTGATTQNSSQSSLEERRKALKIKKQVEKVQLNQVQENDEFIK